MTPDQTRDEEATKWATKIEIDIETDMRDLFKAGWNRAVELLGSDERGIRKVINFIGTLCNDPEMAEAIAYHFCIKDKP